MRYQQEVARKKRNLESLRAEYAGITKEIRCLERDLDRARPADLKHKIEKKLTEPRKNLVTELATKPTRVASSGFENQGPSNDWNFGLPVRKGPRFTFK
jgi:septal ring factor EnvC (AmiA/AmiB activator)